MAQDLNKIFLNVPEAKKDEFTTAAKLAEHERQIAFIHGAGTIATQNEIFTGGTNKDIVVKGGPLDDDTTDSWPEEWTKEGKRIIPANTSLQQILTYLFNATIPGVVGGSAYWEKTPAIGAPTTSITYNNQYGSTGTATSDVKLPLGSQITFSYTANSNITNKTQKVSVYAYYTQNSVNKPSGYFLDTATELTQTTKTTDVYTQTVTATTSGTSVATATFNSSAITSGAQTYVTNTSSLEYNVSNTGISVNPVNFDGHTFYAANNNGEKLTDASKNQVYTISGTQGITSSTPSNSKKIKVTGYIPVFYGKYSDTNITSSFWTADKMTAKSLIETAPTSQNMVTGDGTIFIALPDTHANYNKTLLWKATATKDSLGTVQTTTVNFKHPNTSITTPYKVFYVTNAAQWDGNDGYDLVWS
jgi:hypothetical protein